MLTPALSAIPKVRVPKVMISIPHIITSNYTVLPIRVSALDIDFAAVVLRVDPAVAGDDGRPRSQVYGEELRRAPAASLVSCKF
jgi:hypothetical protein